MVLSFGFWVLGFAYASHARITQNSKPKTQNSKPKTNAPQEWVARQEWVAPQEVAERSEAAAHPLSASVGGFGACCHSQQPMLQAYRSARQPYHESQRFQRTPLVPRD